VCSGVLFGRLRTGITWLPVLRAASRVSGKFEDPRMKLTSQENMLQLPKSDLAYKTDRSVPWISAIRVLRLIDVR